MTRITTILLIALLSVAVLATGLPANAQIGPIDVIGGDDPSEDPSEEPSEDPSESPSEDPDPTPTPTGVPVPGVGQADPNGGNAPGNPQTRPDGNTVWPSGGQPGGAFFDGDPHTTERVDTATPTLAAIEVSRMRFPADDSARVVVLGRDDDFADSLSGSALTGYGPLLFTNSAGLTPETRAEIDRVLPNGGQVWILGGQAAVFSGVQDELEGAGYQITRMGGADRIETSLLIADHLWSNPFGPEGVERDSQAMVMIARAYPRSGDSSGTSGWADAIGAAAPAAARRIPVLLMDGDRGDDRITAWLSARQGSTGAEAVLLGGPAAISAAAEAELDNLADGTRGTIQRYRVAGATRAGTTVQAGVWGNGWTTRDEDPARPARFIVIDGYRADGWAWGLAAAGIAADTNARMVMVSGATVPGASLATVRGCDTPQVDLLLMGPEAVVPGQVAATMDSVDGVSCDGLETGAATLCDAIPAAGMADFLNEVWGGDETWHGGADSTVQETGGAHNCTFRVDYVNNPNGTGRSFAISPVQWQAIVGGPSSNPPTPISPEERQQQCDDAGRTSYRHGDLVACITEGIIDIFVGVSSRGQGVGVAFDPLTTLNVVEERYPDEVLVELAAMVMPHLPTADVLAGQPCFEDSAACR